MFSLVFFFWKINTGIDGEWTKRERGEATHIPQESDSTSVLTGKNCREREALIENSNTYTRFPALVLLVSSLLFCYFALK